jgi:hypothetical protein
MATLDINGRTVDIDDAVTVICRWDIFKQVGDAVDPVVSA